MLSLNRSLKRKDEARIYLSVDEWEYRAVLEENGKPVEFFAERKGSPNPSGNIFIGRVRNVRKALGSAFINIGFKKNAFLTSDKIVLNGERSDQTGDFQRSIRESNEIIVQVLKEPKKTKGATVTDNISFPGRYVVLFPNSDFVAISKKLSEDDRERLKDLLERKKPVSFGVIGRTMAAEADEKLVVSEMNSLVESWVKARSAAKRKKAPQLIYKEKEFPIRIARDIFGKNISEFIIEGEQEYNQVRNYISRWAPELLERLHLYNREIPLFEQADIEEDIRSLLKRKVWLPSGGYIAIDRTEALTAIDVNSGKNVNGENIQEIAFNTNIEAVREVARQIRLRDLGGIIIIDFIDMDFKERQKEINEALIKAFEKNRSYVSVYKMSPIGIVQITRKKLSNYTRGFYMKRCEECNGNGYQITDDALTIMLLRDLKRSLSRQKEKAFIVRVNRRPHILLETKYNRWLNELEENLGVYISLIPDSEINERDFEIVYSGTQKEVEKFIGKPR